MATKITKTLKQDIIAFHFAKSGQRLTNLKKVTTDKLDEIIKKHNINFEETLKEYIDNVQKKEIEKNNERIAQLQREIEENNIIESYLIKYEKLIESDKLLIKNVIVAEENKERDILRRHDEMIKQKLTNELGLQFNGDCAILKPGCELVVHTTYNTATIEEVDIHHITDSIRRNRYKIRQMIDDLSSASKPKHIFIIEGEDDE